MTKTLTGTLALAALLIASTAQAATHTFDIDNLSDVDLSTVNLDGFAMNEINGPYWERSNANQWYWGYIWEDTFGESQRHLFPTAEWARDTNPPPAGMLHLGLAGNEGCKIATNLFYPNPEYWPGAMINGQCVRLDNGSVPRGPLSSHMAEYPAVFQLIVRWGNSGTVIPFDLKSIDIHNASNDHVMVYGRASNGVWWWWKLSGYGNSSQSYMRWNLSTNQYQEPFEFVYWINPADEPTTTPLIGRIQVEDHTFGN